MKGYSPEHTHYNFIFTLSQYLSHNNSHIYYNILIYNRGFPYTTKNLKLT